MSKNILIDFVAPLHAFNIIHYKLVYNDVCNYFDILYILLQYTTREIKYSKSNDLLKYVHLRHICKYSRELVFKCNIKDQSVLLLFFMTLVR